MYEKELLSLSEGMRDYTCTNYRNLHRIPETAHHEVKTNAYIRERLDELGIAYWTPAENITVAHIENGEGLTIGLRCDTDALPVKEETGLEFSSQHEGVMHACGHDAHTAIAITAARLLNENRSMWRGTVKVIFQPAEEGEPGADEVISTGLVDDVNLFFGNHVWSPHKTGELHVSPVVVSAAVDMFTLTINGKGGHGATPEKCNDTVVAASAIVMALQTVVSRKTSPMEPIVLTIGSFNAGNVGNIIAQQAVLKGTLRTLSNEMHEEMLSAVENMAKTVADAYGCTAQLDNRFISGALKNDEQLSEIARKCAVELVGEDKVFPEYTMMLGDDFANYSRIAPICYVQVGIADEKKQTNYAHHNCRFKMDEDMLPVASAWMASCAVRAAEEWHK